jgi:hypothetical protein
LSCGNACPEQSLATLCFLRRSTERRVSVQCPVEEPNGEHFFRVLRAVATVVDRRLLLRSLALTDPTR